jgi:hypothetical protein
MVNGGGVHTHAYAHEGVCGLLCMCGTLSLSLSLVCARPVKEYIFAADPHTLYTVRGIRGLCGLVCECISTHTRTIWYVCVRIVARARPFTKREQMQSPFEPQFVLMRVLNVVSSRRVWEAAAIYWNLNALNKMRSSLVYEISQFLLQHSRTRHTFHGSTFHAIAKC